VLISNSMSLEDSLKSRNRANEGVYSLDLFISIFRV
jgi:hypothetical protein